MKRSIALLLSALMATAVLAETQVPELEVDKPGNLPPLPILSNHVVPLDKKEAQSLRLSQEWKKRPNKPQRGPDGRVTYLFGASLPTLTCSPLQTCLIELQPGEVITSLDSGDASQWITNMRRQKRGDEFMEVLVLKPKDVGISTNLSILTDRRTYSIRLVSRQNQWIPILAFDYPDDLDRMVEQHNKAVNRQVRANTMANGQNLANLDFDFRLDGDSPAWKPIRVYADGSKTYIQFPSSHFNGEAPALVALGNDSSQSEKLINYRVIGDRYVVDRVLENAALIVGVGSHQTKVTIAHGGSR